MANFKAAIQLVNFQKSVELIFRSRGQFGQRILQISPGIDPELLAGGGEARQNS